MRVEKHFLVKMALLALIIGVVLVARINATATPSAGLLKEAQNLLDQHKDDAALVCLNKLISQEPNNAMAHVERSRALSRAGRYDKALEDSNKAINLDPRLVKAYVERAEIYIDTERYPKALVDINKAIKLQPQLAIAYARRAMVYNGLKEYQKAVENCNKAIAIDPKTSDFYAIRAAAFRDLRQYQKALQDCNKALSLNSKEATTWAQRGYIYSHLDEFAKSVRDYSIAIEIDPKSVSTHWLRAKAYEKVGEFEKQIDDLTAAAKIDPKDSDLFEKRAEAYYELGEFQKAIDDCTTARRLDSASWISYFIAAYAYEELGLYDKAIELRTKNLELDKKNGDLWCLRAKDYELIGKFDLAQADRRKAVGLLSKGERVKSHGCDPMIDFKNLTGTSPRDGISKQLKGLPVVLPFKYDDGAHIGIPVQVNGHPLRLMLDTGCAHSDLWEQAMAGVAKSDGAKSEGRKANGKVYQYGSFRARDLKLGTLTLKNVVMEVHEGLVGHKTLSGFLGGNILENFIVTVDYSKKQVTLATSVERSRSRKAFILPMWIRQHTPFCKVRLNEKLELTAVLDTGCPRSMSPDSLLKGILQKELVFKNQIYGPWFGVLDCERVRLKSVGLGEKTFEAPIFDVFPAAEAPAAAGRITLGDDFLSKFKTVTFDYPARRVIFEPK